MLVAVGADRPHDLTTNEVAASLLDLSKRGDQDDSSDAKPAVATTGPGGAAGDGVTRIESSSTTASPHAVALELDSTDQRRDACKVRCTTSMTGVVGLNCCYLVARPEK